MHLRRGMEKPRRYSLFSRIVYEHARLLIAEASFASFGSSSFVRKLYTGVIQQWSSPMASTNRGCASLSMLGLDRIAWITGLFPPFFLVLGSLDKTSARECHTQKFAFHNLFTIKVQEIHPVILLNKSLLKLGFGI